MVQGNHSSAVTHAAEQKGTRLDLKHFYQNESNASAALSAYRQMKNLRRGTMSVNEVKKCMIRKFEKTGSLDVAPGRGPPATEKAIVEEVEIATAEASRNSRTATVSGHSIARALDFPWAAVRTGPYYRIGNSGLCPGDPKSIY